MFVAAGKDASPGCLLPNTSGKDATHWKKCHCPYFRHSKAVSRVLLHWRSRTKMIRMYFLFSRMCGGALPKIGHRPHIGAGPGGGPGKNSSVPCASRAAIGCTVCGLQEEVTPSTPLPFLVARANGPVDPRTLSAVLRVSSTTDRVCPIRDTSSSGPVKRRGSQCFQMPSSHYRKQHHVRNGERQLEFCQ
jgi:hypothetical protein